MLKQCAKCKEWFIGSGKIVYEECKDCKKKKRKKKQK